MSKGFRHGAAGAALNFKVVGGTEQPENPGEHTIWVNTETDISGWVFSPEEPENPIEGLVWIGLGTASPAPFNALKKGGLYCFPTSCVQYVNGSFVKKYAYLFHADSWTQFSAVSIDFYKDGAFGTPYTTYKSNATVTVNSANKRIDITPSSGKHEAFVVFGPVNLSGIAAVTMEFNNVQSIGGGITTCIYIAEGQNVPFSSAVCSATEAYVASAKNRSLSVDVSSLGAGAYYVYCGSRTTVSDAAVRGTQILEVSGI